MQINLKENKADIKAFINVAGINQETPVEEANKLIESFVTQLNSGAVEVEAFKGKDGKWVIGFR